MKIDRFNNFNESILGKPLPEIELNELVPKQSVIEAFKKYGLSVDDKDNWKNDIEYTSNTTISCMFTTVAYAGEIPTNISEILKKIQKDIGADSLSISDTFIVEFEFSESHYPDLYESIKSKKPESILTKHKKAIKKHKIEKTYTKKKRKSEDEAIDDQYKEFIDKIKRMKRKAAKAFADKDIDISIRNIKLKIKRYEIQIAEKELEILKMRDQKLKFKSELKLAELKDKRKKERKKSLK